MVQDRAEVMDNLCQTESPARTRAEKRLGGGFFILFLERQSGRQGL